ncbi:hypothetical protein SLE2022_226980 [Rubroshorea leprosula]
MVGPAWLRVLLGEKFFEPCIVHKSVKKNEKNIFCLNCCITICTHCLPLHRRHRRLQIRRYVYHDVIRLSDAQKFINCSLVQPYTTNRAKVVFLKNRPISRPFRGSSNFCIKCDRSLQEHFLFCSLACKVHHLLTTKNGGKERAESFKELGDGEITPDSVLDRPDSMKKWSCKSTGVSNGDALNCKARFCAATTEFVRKRRSCAPMPPLLSCNHNCSPVAETVGRRKGVPHRSPLN